jgi:hypothetical protein
MKKKLKRGVGRSDPTVRFVWLHHHVIKSAAWESLPGHAIKLLIDVWKRHNGENNDEIAYGCREAQQIGISQWQAGRMFDVLIDRGFLTRYGRLPKTQAFRHPKGVVLTGLHVSCSRPNSVVMPLATYGDPQWNHH